MPTFSDRIIHCACVPCSVLCGKLLLGITLIICTENKYNGTVDFNKLTQFSTRSVWCDWSRVITQLSPPRLAWAHNWIFQCIQLTASWSSYIFLCCGHWRAPQSQTMVSPLFWHKTVFSYLWNPHHGSVEPYGFMRGCRAWWCSTLSIRSARHSK